ncbi:MAG: hypothetical protein Ta2B_09390 [Termitinemataceae bacterium]|nr:MAG: hypothetical protein Ta2B_09390 [Termitinemataceae bacterium]
MNIHVEMQLGVEMDKFNLEEFYKAVSEFMKVYGYEGYFTINTTARGKVEGK